MPRGQSAHAKARARGRGDAHWYAWLWARVAGDALDVALLGSALGRDNPRRKAASLALGNVLAVTAMDVACARQLPA